MFGRALKRTFWVLYDNLFKTVFINLMLFIVYAVITVIFWKKAMYWQAILTAGAFWHLLTPAVMYYWAKIIRGEEKKGMFAELFDGLKSFWWRGLALFLVNASASYVVYLGINFYKSFGSNKLAAILGGIGVWIAFCFVLMQIYLIPVMVLDEKKRVFTSYKKAFIMMLTAPFSSLFVFLVIAYFEVLFWPLLLGVLGPHANTIAVYISMFPMFLLPMLSIVFILLLQLNSTILVYEGHKIYPDLKENWETRTWSNLFRPWEVK